MCVGLLKTESALELGLKLNLGINLHIQCCAIVCRVSEFTRVVGAA